MSFERLVWDGLVADKRQLVAGLLGFVLAGLGFLAAHTRAGSAAALLAAFGVAWLGAKLRIRERRPRDRALFRLGFSREQLATLLVLEALLSGALGAVLTASLAVAAHAIGAPLLSRSVPMAGELTASPEALARMFAALLLFTSAGAVLPACSLGRSQLSGTTVDDQLGSGHER